MNNELDILGKKVIVTGAAGFIGSHLCEELLDKGAIVIGLDDLSAGKMSNVEIFSNNKNYTFINKSITDTEGMDEIFSGVYAIFNNAASKKNICLVDPQKDLLINGGGTLNLLELAVKHKIERFIHASTGSVYGEPQVFPTTEKHPLDPVSYYGVSKLAGERYVNTFHKLYGIKTTILRYFHVYGERQESNEFGGVVSIFTRNILNKEPLMVNGHGNQMRTFTWVKDLVKANLLAVESDVAIGKVYNVASSIQVTINDLATNIVKMMGADSEILHNDPLLGDIMFFDVSNEEIIKDLGIEFTKDFWGKLENILADIAESIKESH